MMLAKALQGAATAAEKIYIESVFSTFLYTGNGSTQTITNGIDLSGEGGLVWLKRRDGNGSNLLFDTARGAGNGLFSNLTDASTSFSQFSSFNSSGFSLGADTGGLLNYSGFTYASWTFRKAAKFFDVVTWSGNNVDGRQIAHSLGSTPGVIIIKNRTSSPSEWKVYHTSLGATKELNLNATTAALSTGASWASTEPTSTVFTVGNTFATNQSGNLYVAYLFAHDAGGFGDSGNDSVVKCGSFTTPSSGSIDVDLGWEPQWLLVKASSNTGGWFLFDNMRGWAVGSNDQVLQAHLSDAEFSGGYGNPTATGFTTAGLNSSQTYIYIAIRRGPMKTPTSGTEVFDVAVQGASSGATPSFVADNIVDAALRRDIGSDNWDMASRLTGTARLRPNTTDDEATLGARADYTWDYMTGWRNGTASSNTYSWMFRRAPGFFDVVAYTGTGVARTVPHNLGVAPELMIVKARSTSDSWTVYSAAGGNTKALFLEATTQLSTGTYWNNTSPTSLIFSVGGSGLGVNDSSATYITYLFASAVGVSKVGSYTGTGTTLNVDCGFTAGARFVLIKRTDSTGSWYIWDSARGIVSGNDPYLLLNSTAAEVTNTDYIDPLSSGFQISSTAPAEINANGGSYIFLAVA